MTTRRYLLSWVLACALAAAVTVTLAWLAGDEIRAASADLF